jgi:hypothetical protein
MSGGKMQNVGRQFHIHEATLRKQLELNLAQKWEENQFFNEEQERELCDHLQVANIFYGVTLIEQPTMMSPNAIFKYFKTKPLNVDCSLSVVMPYCNCYTPLYPLRCALAYNRFVRFTIGDR